MKDIRITLPSVREIIGSKFLPKSQLDYFKKCSREEMLAQSDFAGLNPKWYRIDGTFWTRSGIKGPLGEVLCCNPTISKADCTNPNYNIRPILKFSKPLFNIVLKDAKQEKEYEEVEFGYYPQNIASLYIGEELEDSFSKNLLEKTGRTYTIADPFWEQNRKEETKLLTLDEFAYKGKRYVRFVSVDYRYDYKWIEVLPVRWIVDRKKRYLISKKSLLTGMRYHPFDSSSISFKNTEIYGFLQVMLKDFRQEDNYLLNSSLRIDSMTELSDSSLNEIKESITSDTHISSDDMDELMAAFEQVKEDMNTSGGRKRR